MDRRYIRHPTGVPIEYRLIPEQPPVREPTRNLSVGGLCFCADRPVSPGTDIRITIPVCKPTFELDAKVAWCKPVDDRFDLGVQFADAAKSTAVLIVEQVCHIEQYRKDALDQGRALSSEQAAVEWVDKHADEFPTRP